MAYTFNPTPAESAVLSQIQTHESGGNYTAVNTGPNTHAAGAYQFEPGTWAYVSQQTGVGTQYASAADAPPAVQDANALWLLRNYGPNSTASWGGPDGPPGGYPNPYGSSSSTTAVSSDGTTQPLIDLTGAAASASSTDILAQLESSVGLDPTSPWSDLAVAAAGFAALYLMTH